MKTATTKSRHTGMVEQHKANYACKEVASGATQENEPKLNQFNHSYVRLQDIYIVVTDLITRLDGEPSTEANYNAEFPSMSFVLAKYPADMNLIIDNIFDKIAELRNRIL